MTESVRILIVLGVRLYREGLAKLLSRVEGFEIAGTAETAELGLALAADLRPDVVLLDTEAPGALDLIAGYVASPNAPRVLALAVPESEGTVLACARAGVSGCLTPAASLDEVIAGLRRAARGETHCPPEIGATLLRGVHSMTRQAERDDGPPLLTPREREVMELIDAGLSNRQIARTLYIEPATVKNHVHNILDKLHVERRGEAAALLRRR